MKLKVFAIYDHRAMDYRNPLYFKRTEEAIRSFGIAANDPSTDICKYAEDYSLAELGTYDDDTGLHENHPAPKMITSAPLAKSKHREEYMSAFQTAPNVTDVSKAIN